MIENTRDRDPLLHLLGMTGGTDRYVTDMEAQGQRQLVHSDRLPVKLNGGTDEDFIAVGFSFGDPDKGDPLFRPATLPDGWAREGSGHAMWSYIVDATGRQRVRIFYKAAFYDRDAFMSLTTIQNDLGKLLYGEITEPVIDDWTPREAWIEALTARRDRDLEEAADMDRYYPKGAAEHREQAEICAKHLAILAGA